MCTHSIALYTMCLRLHFIISILKFNPHTDHWVQLLCLPEVLYMYMGTFPRSCIDKNVSNTVFT